MARLWNTGFELQSLTAGVEIETITTAASLSISTSTVNGGAASMKVAPSATNGFITHTFDSTSNTSTHYARFYINIATLPASAITIFQFYSSGNSGFASALKLTSAGFLQLFGGSNGGTQQGSNSSALSTNTWYRIEISTTDTSGNATATLNAYINGTSFATGTGTLTGANTNTDTIRFGAVNSTTSPVFYLDDIAVNDNTGSSQTGLPGAGLLAIMRPTGAGDSSQWTPTSGANWTNVDETPPDDATTVVKATSTTNIDMYALTPPSALNGATINVVAVGWRGNNSITEATGSVWTGTLRLESQSSGTVVTGSINGVKNTTFVTNNSAAPFSYKLVSYTDPQAGGAWTYALLQTAQIGIQPTAFAGSGGDPQITAIWAYVDYVPGVITPPGDVAVPIPLSPVHPEPRLNPMSFEIPYSNAISAAVPATVAQVGATVTFTGGTQAVASVQDVAISQAAATLTFTGGTQAVATVNDVAISQVGATLTFTGGTQSVATVNIVAISQAAATLTFSGGTQVVVGETSASITQVAATLTFTGGVQSTNVNVTQVAAVLTFSGGTQAVATVRIVAVSQSAATLTFSGGTQAVATVNDVAVSQVGAVLTFTGGTQSVATIRDVSISQVGATVTFTGGTQSTATVNIVAISQTAATLTFTGGTQALLQSVSISQVGAVLTFTGGTQIVASIQDVAISQTHATITFTGGTQSFAAMVDAEIAQRAATLTFTGGTQSVFEIAIFSNPLKIPLTVLDPIALKLSVPDPIVIDTIMPDPLVIDLSIPAPLVLPLEIPDPISLVV